jgi:hypothetical protein
MKNKLYQHFMLSNTLEVGLSLNKHQFMVE